MNPGTQSWKYALSIIDHLIYNEHYSIYGLTFNFSGHLCQVNLLMLWESSSYESLKFLYSDTKQAHQLYSYAQSSDVQGAILSDTGDFSLFDCE